MLAPPNESEVDHRSGDRQVIEYLIGRSQIDGAPVAGHSGRMEVESVDVFPAVSVGGERRTEPLHRCGHTSLRSDPPRVAVHDGVQVGEMDVRIAGSDQKFVFPADRPAVVQRSGISDRHVYVGVRVYVQFLDIVGRSVRSRAVLHKLEKRLGHVAADGSLDSDADRPETASGEPAGRNDLGCDVGIQLVIRLQSAQKGFGGNRRVHKGYQPAVLLVKQVAQRHAVRGVRSRNGACGRNGNESPGRTEGGVHRGPQRGLVHEVGGSQLLCRTRQKTAR